MVKEAEETISVFEKSTGVDDGKRKKKITQLGSTKDNYREFKFNICDLWPEEFYR